MSKYDGWYYQTHKEQHRAYAKKWRDKNPEKVRAKNKRYRKRRFEMDRAIGWFFSFPEPPLNWVMPEDLFL
jgi:hypothetical protein